MSAVTCLTIAAALAAAQGGETITLAPSSDCAGITIKKQYASPITIEADGATARTVVVTGAANAIWRGGTIVARDGVGVGEPGYGVHIYNGARSIRFEGVKFGFAKKAVALDQVMEITFTGNQFDGVGEDGIIASQVKGLMITGNTFSRTVGRPTECVVGGSIKYGLAQRDCVAAGGKWTDGFHPDAVQMRNGVTDALIADNIINGDTQGITQMDTIGDAPLKRVRIERNRVTTSTYHPITLSDCIDCAIIGNTVARTLGSTAKKQIISQDGTLACGNVVQDIQKGTEPCPVKVVELK